MQLSLVIEKNFMGIHEDAKLADLVKVIFKSHRNFYPVLTEEGYLIGIILLDDVREIMFNSDMYNTPILNLMTMLPALIVFHDSMEEVLNKFKKTGVWNLPVIAYGVYVGFVSKSKLFLAYRQHLVQITAD